MKNRLLLMLVAAMFTGLLFAQPQNWQESSPDDWDPVQQIGEFDNVSEGNRALKIIFTETGTPYFVSDAFNVTQNSAFSLSMDVLDNDPGAEVNFRVRFLNSNGEDTDVTSSDYTVDNAAFQTATLTGTTPADAVTAYIIVRIYDVSSNWDGDGEFILDNGIYTEDGGANLLVNGGFENWETPVIAANSMLEGWIESVPAEWTPTVIEPELTEVSHGDIAAKLTFTETGTPYIVSDTFDVTAGAAFNASIDVLDNDPAAKVNYRVYFIKADGSKDYITSADNSVDNAAYQTITYSNTVPADVVKGIIILRLQDDAAWAGSGTLIFDNVRYSEAGGPNLVPNGSFELWNAPTIDFLTYSFEALDPVVVAAVNKNTKTVSATVPYGTDVSALVATFTLTEGATAKVGDLAQVSGTTSNDFTNNVTYTLSNADASVNQNWTVSVEVTEAATGKDIISFRFEGLNPAVNGVIDATAKTVTAEVPNGTDLTTLVPTIVLSDLASSSPASDVATDFSTVVTYTVTAQDGNPEDWTVTVTEAAAGRTVLFSEDFESLDILPSDWVIINNDGYTQAAGEERWQDSAWVVTTSGRTELAGTKLAMASSYTSDIPLDGATDDWMILPAISIGNNSTISWQAMSTTSSGNYPDDYFVVIAPAVSGSTPNVDYMKGNSEIVKTVAPESWSAGVRNPGNGLASHSVNLKNLVDEDYPNGWTDMDVWIAFICNTDLYTNPTTGVANSNAGGSNIIIDNILVVNDSGEGVEKNSLDDMVSVYPNPSTGTVMVRMKAINAGEAKIRVCNMLGKVVYRKATEFVSGENEVRLDLDELNSGIYFVTMEINGNQSVRKLSIK